MMGGIDDHLGVVMGGISGLNYSSNLAYLSPLMAILPLMSISCICK